MLASFGRYQDPVTNEWLQLYHRGRGVSQTVGGSESAPQQTVLKGLAPVDRVYGGGSC